MSRYMNIEEAIDNVKFIIGDLKASNYNETFITAIETLLTAYEKEKNNNLLVQIKDMEKEFLEVCEKLRNSVDKDKIKAILEEYKYTEIGDSEKIIEFYKKVQSLLEKEYPITITKEELEKRWKE